MKAHWLIMLLGLLFLVPTGTFADDKEDSKLLYEDGKAKSDSGDFLAAIPLLEKSFTLDNRNFKAQKLLAENLDKKGKTLIASGSLAEALEIYKQAYKLWPNNSDIKATYEGLKNGTIKAGSDKSAGTVNISDQGTPTEEPKTREEVKSQIVEAEKALTEISKMETKIDGTGGAQASAKEKALQEELERQKQLIAKMKSEYGSANTATTNAKSIQSDSQKVEELLFMYQQMLEQQKSEAKTSDMSQFVEVMKMYRTDLEKQSVSPLTVVLIAGGSSLGLILIAFVIVLLFARVQGKKRAQKAQAYANGQQGYAGGLGYGGAPYQQDPTYKLKNDKNFLLGYDGGDQGGPEIAEQAEEVSDEMYKDLLKYDKLKKLHSQMKTGNLNWDSVRENIDILHKDLQTEILKIAEMKINAGDVSDYSSILPVLFPFLTSGDDYLRKKSNVLAYKLVETEKQKSVSDKAAAGSKGEEAVSTELKNLSDIRIITKYAGDLDKLLGLKAKSTNVANYAKRIGVVIGLDKEKIDLLYVSGLVHDFGYFLYDEGVQNEIKNEPRLSSKRVTELSLHPEKGIQFFETKNIVLPKEVEEAILFHHERNDGSGYPHGVTAEQIPVFAKIIAVADVLEALLSDRPFREKMNFNSATIVMKDLARNKLDITYVNALIEFFKKI
jgi:tetratricopeptide (TPR) repeat protein/HD superfamily phosphohydrolase YqeK